VEERSRSGHHCKDGASGSEGTPATGDQFISTRMFGRKQRLGPKEWDERRPPAYDVPTAEAWQERLDARFGIQKKPPKSPK